MKDYLFYTTEDFVGDLSFIRWALGEKEIVLFDELYEKYSHKRKEMDEAIEIIRFLKGRHSGLDDREIYKLWRNIKAQKNQKKEGNFFKRNLKWVAILLIFIFMGGITYTYYSQQWDLENYFTEEVSMLDSSYAYLRLSENKIIRLPSESVQISYFDSADGVRIKTENKIHFSADRQSVHKLVIPYGKRGKLILSDGTKIWINSGSRIIFPSSFGNEGRKVFLVGEAYFEVSNNKQKPFRVETLELDIDILGTSFNVTAYQSDKTIETVVAEGKVNVKKHGFHPFAERSLLRASQRVLYDRKNEVMEKDQVEVNHYISWKEGYLDVKKERLSNIVRQLSRIYNIEIILDQKLSSLEFSGKLDLRKDLESELKIIATAHPIQYKLKNNKVIIKPKS